MTRYSGKAESGLAADGDIPRLVEELNACLAHARAIKTSANIDVYRTTWRNRDVVIKRYKHVGPGHSFRYTLKASRARRAWANGRRLLELGIRTPRPLAYLDEFRGPLLWQSWLITEYVDRPTLHSVLRDEGLSEGYKRRLVHQALRVVDRLGSHGISHGDMKHTNILCDAGRIVLTDLDGMETHRLGWLRRQRRGRDIARFLRGIVPMAPTSPAGPVQPVGPMEPVRSAGGKLWVNRNLRNRELEEALSTEPDRVVERFEARPVPSASTSRVHRFTAVFNGVPTGVYLKEYLDRSVLDCLKHLVRSSRAMRALRASQMLSRHGFHVPEIIAIGSLRGQASHRKRHTCGGVTATREIADAVPVHKYLVCDPTAPPPCSLHLRRELLRQLGLTIGRMHREGIVHGDLRPGNILARRADDRWEFFLIDNERTRRWPYLPGSLRRKNLVQINMLPQGVGNTDRLRFFLAYMLMNPRVRLHFRRWAETVMTSTRKRFRRKGWLTVQALPLPSRSV